MYPYIREIKVASKHMYMYMEEIMYDEVSEVFWCSCALKPPIAKKNPVLNYYSFKKFFQIENHTIITSKLFKNV